MARVWQACMQQLRGLAVAGPSTPLSSHPQCLVALHEPCTSVRRSLPLQTLNSTPSLHPPLLLPHHGHTRQQLWRGYANSAVQSHASSAQPHLEAPPVIISPQACRVVIVGWMGSKKRYLEKYAALWQRSGEHEVLMLRTTIPMTLMRWRGVVKAGTDIDRVARLHIENPAMPTIYHVFSMGGFIHMGTMLKWMDEVQDHVLRHDMLGEIKGIIFDSAPAPVTDHMAARAITTAVLNKVAHRSEVEGGLSAAVTNATQSFLKWHLNKPSIRLREQEVMDAWHDIAPTCPQLYLYSDADPLVPPAYVEEYMKLQQSRGAEVFGHKWADSGHCEHFRKHQHEYAFQISQFMSHALADW